jgi:glycosyltransferase involved in cell wall biosynthesis
MTSRPGLLFIVNSLDVGGAEKQLITLLNRLDSSRFRLHLAYLKRGAALLSQLHTDRLDAVLCCDVTRGIERPGVAKLRELIENRSIDVIVCTNTYSMLYGLLARSGSTTSPKLATVFHTTMPRGYKEKLQMLVYRHLFRRCDLLIYVCENQRRFWRERGLQPKADAVVHNGIDIEQYHGYELPERKLEVRRSLGFGAQDYVVGLCSGLRPEKAHTDLLDALALLRARGVAVKGLFIGEGPERPAIEARMAELSLTQDVRITGLQKDVRPFVACCDVMTLVSRTETFSMAALESMALGKPLVMSDVGGASEQVVHGQNGFLFEPGDIEALAAHLQSLTSEALRTRMGHAAAQRVRQLYTSDTMNERFTERILEVLGPELERPAWLSHYGRSDGDTARGAQARSRRERTS